MQLIMAGAILLALAILILKPIPLEIAPGFATLSIQNIEFQSSNPDFNGPAYLITAVVSGSGEKFYAKITPDLVKSFTGEQTISGDVEIYIDLVEQKCKYPVNVTNEYVRRLTIAKGNYERRFGLLWSVSPNIYWVPIYHYGCCLSSCSSRMDGWDAVGVHADNIKQVARVSSAALYDYKVKVTINYSDGTVEEYITPQQTSVLLDDVGRVKWIGSMVGTQSCPTPATDTIILRDVKTGEYTPHSLQAYIQYASEDSMLKLNLDSAKGPRYYECPRYYYPQAKEGFTEVVTRYNQIVDYLLSSKPPVSPLGEIENIESNLLYVIRPTQPAIFPTIQIVLNAEKVGVIIPQGQPVITEIPQIPIFEGGLYKYPIKIKNLGEEESVFNVKLECPTPVTFRATPVGIGPGEEKTVYLEVSSSQALEEVCTVTAYDINNPELSDVKQFVLKIELQPCPFECCANVSYQPKPCPPYRSKIVKYAEYDPAYYNITGTEEEIVEACKQLDSGCWVLKEKEVIVELYCAGTTCEEGDIIEERELIEATESEPTLAEKETVIVQTVDLTETKEEIPETKEVKTEYKSPVLLIAAGILVGASFVFLIIKKLRLIR